MSALTAIGNRDYYLVIDKSGSMTEVMSDTGKSRWEYCKECLMAIANEIIKLDPDGITVYLYAKRFTRFDNVKSGQIISKIFQENAPFGGTNVTPVLQDAFKTYFANKAAAQQAQPPVPPKTGATVLVVTDGSDDYKQNVINEIANASKAMQNPQELAVNFIQVGNDSDATIFLKWLDDELPKMGGRDIVETIKMDDVEDIGLTEVLMKTLFHTK